jgi:tRNA(fMet)-specific endonuclease VapC
MVNLQFLLDTNVCSEGTRRIPNPGIMRNLQQHEGRLGIATVVWHELLFGWERLPASRRKTEIEDYLFRVVREEMPILPYTRTAAEWHAKERARLSSVGRTPPFLDGQIAAIAKVNGLVLVTANQSDFELFDGLEITDWREGR